MSKTQRINLIERYQNFHQTRENLNFFEKPVPYHWLSLPREHSIESDVDMKRVFWSGYAEDFARDLANAINSLLVQSRNLDAWHLTMEKLDREETLQVYQEFVQSSIALALSMPYTIKSRFYFACAHLSHQANMIILADQWNEDRLPDDSEIYQETAIEVSKNWVSWKKLIKALEKCDSQSFRNITDDFRRRFTHRHDTLLGVETARPVARRIAADDGKVSYAFGGTQRLPLSEISAALKNEFLVFSKAFTSFQDLVREQQKAVYQSP